MIYGGGSIWNIANAIPSGAPFLAGSANDGLSVDPITGRIILGQALNQAGDPARLLKNTEIPLNAFTFEITNLAGNPIAFFDDTPVIDIRFGDVDSVGNDTLLTLSDVLGGQFIRAHCREFIAGDIFPIGNASTIHLDDLNRFIRMGLSAGNVLNLDRLANIYGIGDLDTINNGTSLTINDTALTRIDINAANGVRIDSINGTLLTFVGALFNGAGAAGGTLLNAPVAGNPTKWIRISDGGVNRFIPAW